jgi:hypothetical protein
VSTGKTLEHVDSSKLRSLEQVSKLRRSQDVKKEVKNKSEGWFTPACRQEINPTTSGGKPPFRLVLDFLVLTSF